MKKEIGKIEGIFGYWPNIASYLICSILNKLSMRAKAKVIHTLGGKM